MKEQLIKVLDVVGMAVWIEVTTDQPKCTYYFGPFLSEKEASLAQTGYVEDLEAENAQGIRVQIKRCQPQDLTVFDEPEDSKPYGNLSRLSGQAF